MAVHGQDGGAGSGASDAPPVFTGRGPITNSIDRITGAVENVAMGIASAAVLVMMLLVAVSVIGRELFGAPIPDDVIFQGLLMVGIIALPLAFIHRRDGHIAVTITTDWLPPRVIAALRIFGAILGICFFFIIGWAIARDIPADIANKAVYDGVFELPAWPMKVVFVFGILAFLLRILLSIVVSFIDLVRGAAPGAHDAPREEDV